MSLNLLRISADGRIEARRDSPSDGAAAVAAGAFAPKLAALASDWLAGAEAIYVTGMATARGNWHDSGYVSAPAPLAAFRPAAIMAEPISGCPVLLLPGLSVGGTFPDVMRGEELKIYGLPAEAPATVVLPGKHSKWAVRAGSVITNFATFLSGEIGGLLAKDSILSKLIPAGAASTERGFTAGLGAFEALRPTGGGVLRAVFSARSAALIGGLRPEDILGYLDGLIIAAELAEAQTEFLSGAQSVALIGAESLCARYAQALAARGIEAAAYNGHETAARAAAEIHRLR